MYNLQKYSGMKKRATWSMRCNSHFTRKFVLRKNLGRSCDAKVINKNRLLRILIISIFQSNFKAPASFFRSFHSNHSKPTSKIAILYRTIFLWLHFCTLQGFSMWHTLRKWAQLDLGESLGCPDNLPHQSGAVNNYDYFQDKH